MDGDTIKHLSHFGHVIEGELVHEAGEEEVQAWAQDKTTNKPLSKGPHVIQFEVSVFILDNSALFFQTCEPLAVLKLLTE